MNNKYTAKVNKKFITVKPVPDQSITGGLIIEYDKETEIAGKVAYRNIIAGQSKYQKPSLKESEGRKVVKAYVRINDYNVISITDREIYREVDFTDIKKMQQYCNVCGKSGIMEISQTIPMTWEIYSFFKDKLNDWARYHCSKLKK